MRKGAVTLRDVARRARVSVSTAARALGGYGYVSPATRERVLRAARALDYHPNAVARSMIKGRTHTLGVVVSDSSNPFFAAVVRGIEDVALPYGYGILLCNADEDPRKEVMYLSMLRQKRVDGIIVSPSGESSTALGGLVTAGIPVVQVDRRVRGLASDAVVVDNRAGVFAAVEHLARLGHRDIALIGGPGRLYTGRERTRAFRDALRRLGLPLVQAWLLEGTFKVDSGYRLAARLFESSPRPTAVFVANNLMTIGALLWFKQAGVRIPDDIAVVGFDDMDWAPILTPPLTAVAQPTFELGKTAATLLLGRLQDPSRPPRLVVLPPRLVVRESCGARLAPAGRTGSAGEPTLSPRSSPWGPAGG